MRQRTLGSTGWQVSEFALGAMMFGRMGNPDHDDSIAIIRAALDAGITIVDTADVYSQGESEEIVGKAIRGRRDEVILATKFGLPMGTDPDARGGSRRWIAEEVENSLRRLDTDHIDLYQIHRYDYSTPIEETLGALSDLVAAGKVRAIGSSSFPAELIVEAQWAAEKNSAERFVTEQPRYSILTRRLEAAVLPTTQRHTMGTLTYGPLNSGWLSGRADVSAGHRAIGLESRFDPTTPTGKIKADAVERLTAVAKDAGLTLPQLAIGFVQAHPAVTSVLIGPRTREQLDGLLTATDIELSGEILDAIDEIVQPGTDIDPADNYNDLPPALTDASARRR